MARFLYFLLILFLIRLAWNAVSAMLTGEGQRQMGGRGRRDGEGAKTTINKGLMVRDPVCGLHLPEHRAVTEVRGDERYHFCSENCRESFRKSHRAE